MMVVVGMQICLGQRAVTVVVAVAAAAVVVVCVVVELVQFKVVVSAALTGHKAGARSRRTVG